MRITLAENYFSSVERHASAVLLTLLVAFVLASIYAMQHFTITSDFDGLIKPSTNNDWYWDNENYKAAFPQHEKTALVVISSISAQKAFDTGRALVSTLKQLPQENSPISDVFAPQYDDFFDQYALYYAPLEGVRQITQSLEKQLPAFNHLAENPSAKSALHLYQQMLNDEEVLLSDKAKASFEQLTKILSGETATYMTFIDPLYQRDTEAMHYALVLVNVNLDTRYDNPNQQVIDVLKASIDKLPEDADVSIRITGEIALANDEMNAALSGVELSGALSLVLLLFVLLIGVKYKRLIFGIFLLLVSGISLTVALSLLIVGHFNTLSLIFMVMFFGLAVDFAVHFCLAYLEAGHSPKSLDVFRRIGSALLLCSVTSSIAFLSFTPTDYLGFAELGIISAIGMAVAIFLTLTFLPAWLAMFEHKKNLNPLRLKGGNPRYSLKQALWVSFFSGIFLAGGGYFATKTAFDFSVLAMQDADSEAMTVLNELHHQGFSSDYSLAILADESVNQEALVRELMTIESVKSVKLPEDYLPKFQPLKQALMQPLGERIARLSVSEGPLPDHGGLAIQLQLFKSLLQEKSEAFFDEDQPVFTRLISAIDHFELTPESITRLNQSASQGLSHDLNLLDKRLNAKPATLDDLPASLKARLISQNGQQLIQVVPDIDVTDHKALAGFIEDVSTVAPNLAGRAIVEWGVGDTVQRAFFEAISLAIVIIFLILAACYRSILVPLIVFVPLVMTAVFIFNVMYWTGFSLNMANILVVPLIFGLGVDTGLHIMHQLRQQKRQSMHKTTRIEGSSTHRAVLISALTTIGTFFSLAFSSHNGTASIGILLSLAIAFLIVASFFVLPALNTLFRR
ncbi:MAG: MMPL family transporter [Cellvibrionales bacterium]|nr:MMPL family transporter [Cellvibrionales bacterium]